MQKGLEGRMLPEMMEDDTSYSGRCEKVNNGSCQEEGIIFQASVAAFSFFLRRVFVILF